MAPTDRLVQSEQKEEGKEEETKREVEKPEEVKPMTVEDGQSLLLVHELAQLLSHAETLQNITLIGRAVSTIEPRFTARVLRTLTTLRRKLTKSDMKSVLNQAFPKGCKYHIRSLGEKADKNS